MEYFYLRNYSQYWLSHIFKYDWIFKNVDDDDVMVGVEVVVPNVLKIKNVLNDSGINN